MDKKKRIESLFLEKTKIDDVKDLNIICEYLNVHFDSGKYCESIEFNFGRDYAFTIHNIHLTKLNLLKIRPESVFKFNFVCIINQLKCNDIDIELLFEKTSTNQIKINTRKNYYKHDVLIKLGNDVKNYEIAVEYNEKKSHNNTRQIINDNNRTSMSEQFLDLYYEHNEGMNNYRKFIKDITYDILVCICSLKNDKYLLAKILYFKDNENISSYEEDDFKLFLNCKKNDEIDLEHLHDMMKPRNQDNEEYTFDEYIEYLENEYDLEIKDGKCSYKDFKNIINNEPNDSSQKIIEYRTVISNVADKLTDASDEMFKMMERLNKKTQNIPSYTINILKNLHTIADTNAVERGIENYQKFSKCKIK